MTEGNGEKKTWGMTMTEKGRHKWTETATAEEEEDKGKGKKKSWLDR